jgi:hypothetical protein
MTIVSEPLMVSFPLLARPEIPSLVVGLLCVQWQRRAKAAVKRSERRVIMRSVDSTSLSPACDKQVTF